LPDPELDAIMIKMNKEEDKPSKLRITIDRIKLKAFEAGFLAGRKSGGCTEIALRNAAKLDRVTTSIEWEIASQSQTQ
jgi:hypothetical protein